MRESFWGNVASLLFGGVQAAGDGGLHTLILILSSATFSLLTIGVLVLLGKYFVQWVIREVGELRERDSFERDFFRSSGAVPFREKRRHPRRLRRLLGIRYRRRP